jgi:hypothetical protein
MAGDWRMRMILMRICAYYRNTVCEGTVREWLFTLWRAAYTIFIPSTLSCPPIGMVTRAEVRYEKVAGSSMITHYGPLVCRSCAVALMLLDLSGATLNIYINKRRRHPIVRSVQPKGQGIWKWRDVKSSSKLDKREKRSANRNTYWGMFNIYPSCDVVLPPT